MQNPLPRIVQGGMGVAVSSWQLARAVSLTGQLGVVSGTALDTVVARRLQEGDPEGDVRRALDRFPFPQLAEQVHRTYFRPGGRDPGRPYRPVPRISLRPNPAGTALQVVANFVEVWLAKRSHRGRVGINYLEKLQLATPAAVLGALLADVDAVLMGAGIPRQIPRLLDDLAAGRPGRLSIDVHGGRGEHALVLDPRQVLGKTAPAMPRPPLLAVVSSEVLAAYLARDTTTRPDGIIVEGSAAGGHNAPPRGPLRLDEHQQPVYGPRDVPDLDKLARLGLPYWLAGGWSSPARLAEALEKGAAGVQVGTLFALSHESGLTADLREQLLQELGDDSLTVRTAANVSPTGFPFKVAQLAGTLSQPAVYEQRERRCDLGYLRTLYLRSDGRVGYRCPAEPVHAFTRKGGSVEETRGRSCLCNALTATVGLPQTRHDSYREQPLVTLGTDLDSARTMLERHPTGWTAADVVAWLLSAA